MATLERSGSKVSEAASSAGGFLWHGPTWMNRKCDVFIGDA
jgi:hypothetical protein